LEDRTKEEVTSSLDIEGAVIHGTEKAVKGIIKDIVENIVIKAIFEGVLQDVINEHTRLIYHDVTAIKVILFILAVLIFIYFFVLLFVGVGLSCFISS
jgi:hypothetical protein